MMFTKNSQIRLQLNRDYFDNTGFRKVIFVLLETALIFYTNRVIWFFYCLISHAENAFFDECKHKEWKSTTQQLLQREQICRCWLHLKSRFGCDDVTHNFLCHRRLFLHFVGRLPMLSREYFELCSNDLKIDMRKE